MDLRHKVALIKTRTKLFQDLEVDGVLDYMIQWGIFSSEDSDVVRSKDTNCKRTQQLLDILPQRGDKAFEGFLQALLESNQGHLGKELQETVDNITVEDVARSGHGGKQQQPGTMGIPHQIALGKASSDLVNDLSVTPVLNELLAKLIITQQEFDVITQENSRVKQTKALLALLPLKDDDAFETFSQLLLENYSVAQPWLYDKIVNELNCITQDDISFARYMIDQFGVVLPFSEGLQRELQMNLDRKLKEENTSLAETLLNQAGKDGYITQPASGEKHEGEDSNRPISVTSVCRLLEDCPVGERVIVYGDAGMGKTTLLTRIAQMWVDGNSKLANRFDFVFLIRFRAVRSESLSDIIVKDEKLLSFHCVGKLRQMLESNPNRVLFLLDSFEELMCDEGKEIYELITRDMAPGSTVVVTSRPGSYLPDVEEKVIPRIRVQLEHLPEEQVIDTIRQYSHGQRDTLSTITEAFFDISFLRTPIIMVLACFLCSVMSTNSSVGLPTSQTALYNLVLQHILLAYVKKKKNYSFEPDDGSPLENDAIPLKAKDLLWTVGEMSYSAMRKGKQLCRFPKGEFEDFGLFIDGPDMNTVVLPHLSFQEFWAAMYVSADVTVWEELLAELRNSSRCSPETCLRDLLNPLENVAKFLVGFYPKAAEELSSLFVIKQQKTWLHWFQSNLQYELELLHECTEDMKPKVASSLLNAPIVAECDSYRSVVSNKASHTLLKYFSEEEALRFLKKAYGHTIYVEDRRAILCEANQDKHFVWDSFVVACVYSYNCAVKMNEVKIVHSHLLVDMITQNLMEVRKLHVKHSTLCSRTSEFVSSLNIEGKLAKRFPQRPKLVNESVQEMLLEYIHGLDNLCDIKMHGLKALRLSDCGEVVLDKLKHTCVNVRWLRLEYNKLRYSSARITWPSVKQLEFVVSPNVRLDRLADIFVQLERLESWSCAVSLESPQCRWYSLKHFDLFTSPLLVTKERLSERQARRTILEICPEATIVIKSYEMGLQRIKREDMERRAAERAMAAGVNF